MVNHLKMPYSLIQIRLQLLYGDYSANLHSLLNRIVDEENFLNVKLQIRKNSKLYCLTKQC